MKINDTGFVFIKLNNSAIYTKYFETIRKLIDANPLNQIIVFNSYNEKINTNSIPILHLSHAKFFYGDLFLFDLSSVIVTKSFTNINKRYLYVNNAPWIDAPQVNYQTWENIYNADNLEFIAQNKTLYDLYSVCWKKPIGISENFNYTEIAGLIEKENKK
jgi:hypothetical protein